MNLSPKIPKNCAASVGTLSFYLMRGRDFDDARGQRKSARYNDIADGTVTPPLKLGQSSFWPSYEVEAMLLAYVRGASKDELRELVKALVAQRGNPAQEELQQAAKQRAQLLVAKRQAKREAV